MTGNLISLIKWKFFLIVVRLLETQGRRVAADNKLQTWKQLQKFVFLFVKICQTNLPVYIYLLSLTLLIGVCKFRAQILSHKGGKGQANSWKRIIKDEDTNKQIDHSTEGWKGFHFIPPHISCKWDQQKGWCW